MVFTQRFERTVDRDNTVSFYNLIMQLERAEWRPTLAGCKVIIQSALGHYTDPHDRRTSRRSLRREGKLLTPLTKKQIKAGKDPPPLRLLNDETGHFICSQKRTFSLANDISGSATIRPELIKRTVHSSSTSA